MVDVVVDSNVFRVDFFVSDPACLQLTHVTHLVFN